MVICPKKNKARKGNCVCVWRSMVLGIQNRVITENEAFEQRMEE